MIRKITFTLFIVLLLTSCGNVSEEIPTGTPADFATAPLPTQAPPTASPTIAPPTPTATVACEDKAVFVQDVTYPDNARINSGEQFTKTWKLQNTGTCKWIGYTVVFVSGDRMEAPESVPVPETEAGAQVELSIDLVAPATDGPYTANFELRNAAGAAVPIGTEPTFWTKIIVGETADPLGVTDRIGNCEYTENPELVQQLIDLINKGRADAGLRPLTVNDKLMAAAQAHSLDMACSGDKFLVHSGTDGLYTGERLTKLGYTDPYYVELLANGLPGDAIHEWSRHDNTRPALTDVRVREIGVGYVYSKLSRYGGYWTVVMGGK